MAGTEKYINLNAGTGSGSLPAGNSIGETLIWNGQGWVAGNPASVWEAIGTPGQTILNVTGMVLGDKFHLLINYNMQPRPPHVVNRIDLPFALDGGESILVINGN